MPPKFLRLALSLLKALGYHRALSTKLGGPKLPYDIWVYITSFLDGKTVARLYSVNRELLSIAMDELYREGCIGYHTSDPKMHACIWDKSWGPRLAAPRMKHLLLQSGIPYREKVTGRFHQRLAKSMTCTVTKAYMESEINKVMNVVPKMTSIMALSIWFNGLKDPWHYASKREILRKGWSIFRQNLRTLVLLTPLEDIPDILEGPQSFHT